MVAICGKQVRERTTLISRTKTYLLILVLVAAAVLVLARKGSRDVAGPSASPVSPRVATLTQQVELVIPLSQLREIPIPDREALLEDFHNADRALGYEYAREVEPDSVRPTSLQSGQQLYMDNCSTCHGIGMDGAGEYGPSLDPPPTNLLRSENYKYGKLHLGIYRSTHYGVEGTGMAPWGTLLDPQEIWDLTHYIVAYRAAYESTFSE